LAALVVAADQLSKLLVILLIPYGFQIPLIPGFFRLVHVRNPGAAFGIFADLDPRIRLPFLLATSFVAMAVIIYMFVRHQSGGRWWRISLALILGGAISNTAERLFRGEVVDYLDVFIGDWHWPAFNVADSAVTIGMLILARLVLFTKPAEAAGES
jgi:signal peptidase II